MHFVCSRNVNFCFVQQHITQPYSITEKTGAKINESRGITPFTIDVAEYFTYFLTFLLTLNDSIDLELIFEQTPKPSVSIRAKIVIKKENAP